MLCEIEDFIRTFYNELIYDQLFVFSKSQNYTNLTPDAYSFYLQSSTYICIILCITSVITCVSVRWWHISDTRHTFNLKYRRYIVYHRIPSNYMIIEIIPLTRNQILDVIRGVDELLPRKDLQFWSLYTSWQISFNLYLRNSTYNI
jgi:hypothetical protein